VVVPAHQEEAVIGRCLDALAAQVVPGEVDVVVVANGCRDRTAAVARAHPLRPEVVELAVGSKSAALNAGDAAVTGFPRLYLDADIVLGAGAVAALLEVLTDGPVCAAAPTPRFETAGRPWLVRAYYRTWQRLPFLVEEPIGNGVYALSGPGRSRFTGFPDLIADDLYVLRHFTRDERRAVRGVHFVVQAPRRVRDLLAVRTRAYLGATELAAWQGGRLAGEQGSRARSVARLVRRPADVPDVVAYCVVSLIAAFRAGRRWRRGDTATWDRDSSTR
jgi:glycosyltransferase involved in cell wall biosynthesis